MINGSKYQTLKRGGQSKCRFVKLDHYMIDCEAYMGLKPASRTLFSHIKRLYNGANNGRIAMSVRRAALILNSANNTAKNALDELVEKGFLKVREKGAFSRKVRHATEYILTDEDYEGQTATKDFMRYGKK